jgi:hypothetical protein
VTADSITVVRSHGPRLAKLVHPSSAIDGYDACKTVDLYDVPVDGLGALEELLRQLQSRWDCAAVRGAIADPARTRGVRRLLYADLETGELPSLVDTPRSWVGLDIDALPAPPDCDVSDLLACAGIACARLPTGFRDATLLVQATGSHGIKPGLHLRLWSWLSRAAAGTELKVWLKGAPVDHSVFNACQLIYTGVPVFAAGATDPLPERIAVRFGRDDVVAVPDTALLRPARRTYRPPPPPGDVRASAYAANVLAQLAAHIMRAPVGQRHTTIVTASRRLAELEAAGLLATEESEELLAKAAKGAGIGDDGRDVAKEITGILRWARRSCGLNDDQ